MQIEKLKDAFCKSRLIISVIKSMHCRQKKWWNRFGLIWLSSIVDKMKNEEWKKKPTMQEKDSLAGGVEVGWKSWKYQGTHSSCSQDEVMKMERQMKLLSTAATWRKICSSFSSEARVSPFKQRQMKTMTSVVGRFFPLHHPVLPENWRVGSRGFDFGCKIWGEEKRDCRVVVVVVVEPPE